MTGAGVDVEIEWGVRRSDGNVMRCANEYLARLNAAGQNGPDSLTGEVVRRTVTYSPWRESCTDPGCPVHGAENTWSGPGRDAGGEVWLSDDRGLPPRTCTCEPGQLDLTGRHDETCPALDDR
jgi:hypothetical protein